MKRQASSFMIHYLFLMVFVVFFFLPQSIDFNHMPNDNSQVAIHKRNRNNDENASSLSSQSSDLSTFEAQKKKKLKLVANDYYQSPPLQSQTSTASSSSMDNLPKPVDVMDVDSELPKDRKDLLHFVSAK